MDLKFLLDKAIKLHVHGKLDKAEIIYDKIIKFDANNVFNVAPIDDRSCDITMLINYDESECHYFEIIELVNGITYDLERRDIYKFAK